jgi:ABC-type Fe3+-hydroxamate transport system substrate-binding protein
MSALGNFDDLGLNSIPQCVVSLVPSVTESLFDLGCGDRVRGVTDYCVFPADKVRDLPKVGGTKSPDLGRIKALLPDLVIASREETGRDSVEALQAEGFKVWVTFPKTVAGTFELLWAIVRLFDVPHMGRVIDTLERVYEYAALAAENMPQPKVFVPIWREPKAPEKPRWWMTANRETYTHDLLRVCGGANVFADRERRYPLAADLGEAPAEPLNAERDTRYPRVTPAEVAERAPDVILLPSEPYAFGKADLAAIADSPVMPAVQNGRIHLVDGTLLTWPGTRVGKALGEIPGYFNFVTLES